MGFTHSRSAVSVKLELYELEALIDWHRGQEYTYADDREYVQAECCKQRREDLERQAVARREELKAEATALSNSDNQ